MSARRAEGNGLEHGNPAIRQRIGGEIGGCCLGELRGEISGETDAGLGRLRRQLQRSHHTTYADGGIDVFEPQAEFFLLLCSKSSLQLCGELASGFVATDYRIFRRGHHAAKVAEIEFLEIGLGSVGAVEPLGDTKLGQQLLGNSQQACGGDLFLAFRTQTLVLLVHGLANGRNAARKGTLRNGTLCLGKVGQHGVAMLATRLEALCLRTQRQLGRSLEARLAIGARPAIGARSAVGTGPTLALGARGAVATV